MITPPASMTVDELEELEDYGLRAGDADGVQPADGMVSALNRTLERLKGENEKSQVNPWEAF